MLIVLWSVFYGQCLNVDCFMVSVLWSVFKC